MSGGGGKHRAPIEMPPDNRKGRKGKKGKGGGPAFQIDRDTADLRPPDGDASAYNGPAMRSAVVHHVITAFLVAMVLAVGTWGYLTFKNADSLKPELAAHGPVFEIPSGDAQLERFRFALGVYFRIYDKYPPDIDALVDEGLLASSDLGIPRGSSTIQYERVGDSYQLSIERTIITVTEEAAGDGPADAPDGGTDDDEDDAG